VQNPGVPDMSGGSVAGTGAMVRVSDVGAVRHRIISAAGGKEIVKAPCPGDRRGAILEGEKKIIRLSRGRFHVEIVLGLCRLVSSGIEGGGDGWLGTWGGGAGGGSPFPKKTLPRGRTGIPGGAEVPGRDFKAGGGLLCGGHGQQMVAGVFGKGGGTPFAGGPGFGRGGTSPNDVLKKKKKKNKGGGFEQRLFGGTRLGPGVFGAGRAPVSGHRGAKSRGHPGGDTGLGGDF